MRKTLLLLLLFESFLSFSQEKKQTLKIFTFSEVEKIQQQNPKPIIVFITTDWCKICYGMKSTTLEDRDIIQLLNEKFYFIQLNGEEKKDITFLKKIFVHKPTGTNTGLHELANQLGSVNSVLVYPTTTFLNTKFEIDLQLTGFYNTKRMKQMLAKYN
jgi:thioredoxin-related protein